MREKMYKASDVIGILLEEITYAEFFRVTERMSDIPSAVVRCKDCVHRDPEDHKCDCGGLERQGCPFEVDDDYYCKYGERRSE